MEELQIAISMADILKRLQHYSAGEYEISDDDDDDDDDDDGYGYNYRYRMMNYSSKPNSEELQLSKLRAMTEELAMSRARSTSRDFGTVLKETELEVSIQLAGLLAGTVDPILEGLRKVAVVDQEDGEVCGVCQDEMKGNSTTGDIDDDVRAMGCMHRFHAYCIYKWLQHKNVCPLCMYQM